MKVALKDIKPNPWRYINKGYPIDKAKVEKLRSSIQRTGFWDNLVARKSGENGCVEIAYGHHRIEALRQEFEKNHEIDVIVRDLDDATMLKIMAAENDAMDVMSPAIINETVRASISYLSKESQDKTESELFTVEEIAKRRRGAVTSKWGWPDAEAIHRFLDWPIHRVQVSITALKDIKAGVVDKAEYESIPFQEAADKFRLEIKQNPLPKAKREPIVEKIRRQEIGTKHIRREILKAKFPNGNGQKKSDVMLDDIADKVSLNLRECATLLTDEFIENAKHLSHRSVENLSGAVSLLYKKLVLVKGNLKKGETLLIGVFNGHK